MSLKLTRQALYDLVWSKPRTTLAKELGVSDVSIGKHCRALNVPAPPPGYWANRAAGGKPKAKYQRPPLTYTVAERMQADHDAICGQLMAFDAEDLTQLVPPAPVFAQTVEEAVVRYVGLARAQSQRLRHRDRHPVVLKLIAEDERRAAEASPYSWRRPEYLGASGHAVLHAIDKIAWHWTDCGLRVGASGRHDIELYVSRGANYASGFEIRAAEAPPRDGRRGRTPTQAALEFWFKRERDRDHRHRTGTPAQPAAVFTTLDEATLDSLTSWIFTAWERSFRSWVVWRHQYCVDARVREVRRIEEAVRQERERREAEVRALHTRRHRMLARAIDRAQKADQMRKFVEELQARAAAQGVDDEAMARWKVWALAQADAMDLRVQSAKVLEEWVEGFELGRDASPE